MSRERCPCFSWARSFGELTLNGGHHPKCDGTGKWKEGIFMSGNTDANETDVLAISQRQFESLTAQLEAANKRVEIYERALKKWRCKDCGGHGDGFLPADICIACKGTGLNRIASEALANEGGK